MISIYSLNDDGDKNKIASVNHASIGGMCYASLLDGLIASIPSENKLVFIAPESGEVTDLCEGDRLNAPTCLCVDSSGETLFTMNKDVLIGIRIKSMIAFDVIGSRVKNEYLSKGHDKTGLTSLMCKYKRGVLIARPQLHRVCSVGGAGGISYPIGSGERGFSISQSPETTLLDSPSGIEYAPSAGSVFVSDTNNGVIRLYARFMKPSYMIGNPSAKEIVDGPIKEARVKSPGAIKFGMTDSVFFIDDKTTIRRFNIATRVVSTVHSGSPVIALASGQENIFWAEQA